MRASLFWLLPFVLVFASSCTRTPDDRAPTRTHNPAGESWVTLVSDAQSLGCIAIPVVNTSVDLDHLLRSARQLPPDREVKFNSLGQVDATISREVAVALPGYSKCKELSQAPPENTELAADDEVVRGLRFGTPYMYGKLRGQKTGQAGVLYASGGLGDPRAEWTPPGTLIRSWDEFERLLERVGTDVHPDIHIFATTKTEIGEYALVGFSEREIPARIRQRLRSNLPD